MCCYSRSLNVSINSVQILLLLYLISLGAAYRLIYEYLSYFSDSLLLQGACVRSTCNLRRLSLLRHLASHSIPNFEIHKHEAGHRNEVVVSAPTAMWRGYKPLTPSLLGHFSRAIVSCMLPARPILVNCNELTIR